MHACQGEQIGAGLELLDCAFGSERSNAELVLDTAEFASRDCERILGVVILPLRCSGSLIEGIDPDRHLLLYLIDYRLGIGTRGEVTVGEQRSRVDGLAG